MLEVLMETVPQAYTTRTTCRMCHSPKLAPLFSLGVQYINNFINKEDLHKCGKAPLEMVLCENCTLVQLRHTAPQELLYARFYWYKSGITDTMKKALRDITEKAEKMFDLKAGDVVLDIGSNDGTLLRTYAVPGLVTVGVEPANNLAEEGSKGISHFIHDFWTLDGYSKAVGKKAKVVTAIGMFYDMEDPNQFVADAANALTDDGVFIAQLMCLKNMLDSNDVGNICHEHLEYYSFKSLEYLFNKNGLEIIDVEINYVNGGSYRIYSRKVGAHTRPAEGAAERIRKVRDSEKGFERKEVYLDFFNRLEENKKKCVDFIKQEVAKGKKVWVYGASTKGNVILQYYGLGPELITGASERSSFKWGKYTVGSMILIYSEEEARKAQPDYFLVLPYAFFKEFYDREEEWRKKGGKFIVPLPEFRIAPAKKGLVLGITGQDGSYLAEVLLSKGYEVHGFVRRSATGNTKNIDHLMDKITLHRGDLADATSLYRVIAKVMPEEIYNEADQDHVSWSYDGVGYSCDITGAAVGRILEIIKQVNPKIKYFQPVSSNMFGKADNPQTEETHLRPQSPYACAKAFAYLLCRYYRDVFGMHVSTGIFYNHESPRRTEEYVTRKITMGAARIKLGLQQKLSLGNLDLKIDFGYAREYMEAAWSIMQLDKPDDFIICTGELHSVKEWLEEAFNVAGLKASDYVEFDPRFARPSTTSPLLGSNFKAREKFGFDPKVRFKELVRLMVEQDMKLVGEERKK